MNMTSSPILGLRKICINYLFYDNVFKIITIISRNNFYMVQIQYTFTYTKDMFGFTFGEIEGI